MYHNENKNNHYISKRNRFSDRQPFALRSIALLMTACLCTLLCCPSATQAAIKASFKWYDGWENKGTGTLKFIGKGRIEVTMKETTHAEWNRATLLTNGTKLYIRYKKNIGR